jgi:hypothetical protein
MCTGMVAAPPLACGWTSASIVPAATPPEAPALLAALVTTTEPSAATKSWRVSRMTKLRPEVRLSDPFGGSSLAG